MRFSVIKVISDIRANNVFLQNFGNNLLFVAYYAATNENIQSV